MSLQGWYTVMKAESGVKPAWTGTLQSMTGVTTRMCALYAIAPSLVPRPHPQWGKGSGLHRALSEFCRANQIHAMWFTCDNPVTQRNSHLLLRVRAVDALPSQKVLDVYPFPPCMRVGSGDVTRLHHARHCICNLASWTNHVLISWSMNQPA